MPLPEAEGRAAVKVKQRATRTEVTEVDLTFPVYIEHDVGDYHKYIVTYRYELQNARIPTFLVTTITETDRGFEIAVAQSMSIDTDAAENLIDERRWSEAVERFAKWTRESMAKLLKVQQDGSIK